MIIRVCLRANDPSPKMAFSSPTCGEITFSAPAATAAAIAAASLVPSRKSRLFCAVCVTRCSIRIFVMRYSSYSSFSFMYSAKLVLLTSNCVSNSWCTFVIRSALDMDVSTLLLTCPAAVSSDMQCAFSWIHSGCTLQKYDESSDRTSSGMDASRTHFPVPFPGFVNR